MATFAAIAVAVLGGEWAYMPSGTVRHKVRPGDAGAACGRRVPDADEWRGTGSQDEYERVEQLPPCKDCLRAVGATQ